MFPCFINRSLVIFVQYKKTILWVYSVTMQEYNDEDDFYFHSDVDDEGELEQSLYSQIHFDSSLNTSKFG